MFRHLCNGIRKEVTEVVGEFLNAAFPWVALGIATAVALTYIESKKKKQDNK